LKLRLLYFGIVREKLGRREEVRECKSGATVEELLVELAASHDIFALGAGSLRIAVNREYVFNDHVLADDDEVAVIPPVAGGCGADARPPGWKPGSPLRERGGPDV